MDTQARNSIRHLTQVVERLIVRLQQAEAHIEELSGRIADGPTEMPHIGHSTMEGVDMPLSECERKIGMSPALGAPYDVYADLDLRERVARMEAYLEECKKK